jgi:NADH-quinone oxidoreductase subunit J
MQVIGYIVLECLVFIGAAFAVLSRRLFPAVISLGIGSALLATLFFWLGAPYAGGFELSVGAGLISVLFLIIISLTETMGGQHDEE